jgi:hypothetical protein
MKSLNFKHLLLFGSIVIILGLGSCSKDKYDFDKLSNTVELNHSFAGPLIKGALSIKKLVDPNDTIVFHGENEDSIKIVVPTDSVIAFNPGDIFTLPAQEINEYQIVAPFDIPSALMPNEFRELDTVELYAFTFEDNERLDSMVLNEGEINVDVRSTFNHTGWLLMTVPGVTINGIPLFDSVQISQVGGSYIGSKTIPLTGGTMAFEDSIANASKLAVIFDLTLLKTPGEGVQAGQAASIDFSVDNLDYKELYGYFGQKTYELDEDTLDLELELLDNVSGTFTFGDPKININYTNTFGIPLGINISLSGIFDDGRIVPPSNPQLTIHAPHLPNTDTSGTAVIDKRLVPNLLDLLTYPPPSKIIFKGDGISNPAGNPSRDNFIFDDSKMEAEAEVELPMYFKADLQVSDTMDFNLANEDNIDFIEYINLWMIVKNGFPVDLKLELTPYDSITQTTYESIELDILRAADIDDNAVVIPGTAIEREKSVSLNEEQVDNFVNKANKIIITGTLFTTKKNDEAQFVKILTSYTLDFKLGLDAKIHYVDSLD